MNVAATFNHIAHITERTIVLPYSTQSGLTLNWNHKGPNMFVRAKRHAPTGFWYSADDMETGIIVFLECLTPEQKATRLIPSGWGIMITHTFNSKVAARGRLIKLAENTVDLAMQDAASIISEVA